MRLHWYDVAHFLLGLSTGLFLCVDELVMLAGVILFCWYELVEELRIWDRSYRDILAFGVGWSLGVLCSCYPRVVRAFSPLGLVLLGVVYLVLSALSVFLWLRERRG